MTDIVHIRHPVPVRFIPRGGRKERLEFAQAVTPVTLREVDLEEMAPVHMHHMSLDMPDGFVAEEGGFRADPRRQRFESSDSRIAFFAHGGDLWQRLRTYARNDVNQPLPREALVRFLAGDFGAETLAGTDLGRAFKRTPVLGLGHDGLLLTGSPLDPARVRQMVDDGTERAAADLRRFMDGNVRVAGDAVFLRHPGPLLYTNSSGRYYSASVFPRHGLGNLEMQFLPVRRDRVDAFAAFMSGIAPQRFGEDAFVEGKLAQVRPQTPRDDDLLLIACDAPRMAIKELTMLTSLIPRGRFNAEQRLATLRNAVDALQPWTARGILGALDHGEIEECLTRTLASLDQARAITQPRPPIETLASFIRGYALPLARDAVPVADEDLDALSGLGPGGP